MAGLAGNSPPDVFSMDFLLENSLVAAPLSMCLYSRQEECKRQRNCSPGILFYCCINSQPKI